MNISQKLKQLRIKKVTKAIIATIATFVLGISIFYPTLQNKVMGEGSNAPRFNFLQGDYEMLEAAKTTDSTWADPINASIGDRVTFLLYYHNGVLDSTAHNTKVRVDLPTIKSNQLVAKSWLWSDETSPISDTIVNGNIVGLSGATINLPSSGRIEYVSGSTKLYAEGSHTPVSMPDGINTNSGLNIGDIQGCWNHAGFVTILADIKGQANLVLDKTVAHSGDATWQKEITAHPGDSIAYHLGIRNDGDILANNVTITDALPQYMLYTAGSAYAYTKDHPEGIKLADSLFTTGVALSNITPGQENVVYVTYRTTITTNMSTGTHDLFNLAKVYMAGIEQDQDQAKVTVTIERGLVVDKKVSNGVSWVEENTAKLGDVISYRIIVRNTGNVRLDNVKVRDILPVFVNYITGSTTVDGVRVGDQVVTTQGLNIGSLNPGQEKTIILSGQIYGCPPVGGYKLVNTAYAKGDSVNEISDSATTDIEIISPTAPKIN